MNIIVKRYVNANIQTAKQAAAAALNAFQVEAEAQLAALEAKTPQALKDFHAEREAAEADEFVN